MKLKKIAAVIMMAAMIGGTGVTAYAQDAKPVTIDVQKAELQGCIWKRIFGSAADLDAYSKSGSRCKSSRRNQNDR